MSDCNTGCSGSGGSVIAIPGPPGPPGGTAPAGIDGLNAFSFFTVAVATPFVNGTTAINVDHNEWMALGQIVYVQFGGYYVVVSKTDTNIVVLRNLGTSGNSAPGTLLPVGTQISPAGPSGATGLVGSPTFNVGTAGVDFNIAQNDLTFDFNLPTASGTNRGALASGDWNSFNNRVLRSGDTMTGTLQLPRQVVEDGNPIVEFRVTGQTAGSSKFEERVIPGVNPTLHQVFSIGYNLYNDGAPVTVGFGTEQVTSASVLFFDGATLINDPGVSIGSVFNDHPNTYGISGQEMVYSTSGTFARKLLHRLRGDRLFINPSFALEDKYALKVANTHPTFGHGGLLTIGSGHTLDINNNTIDAIRIANAGGVMRRALGASGNYTYIGDTANTGVVLSGNQSLFFDTDNVADVGSSGGSRPRDVYVGRNIALNNELQMQPNVRQAFTPGSTRVGFNLGTLAADPTEANNGDAYYNTTRHRWRYVINGVWQDFGGGIDNGHFSKVLPINTYTSVFEVSLPDGASFMGQIIAHMVYFHATSLRNATSGFHVTAVNRGGVFGNAEQADSDGVSCSSGAVDAAYFISGVALPAANKVTYQFNPITAIAGSTATFYWRIVTPFPELITIL